MNDWNLEPGQAAARQPRRLVARAITAGAAAGLLAWAHASPAQPVQGAHSLAHAPAQSATASVVPSAAQPSAKAAPAGRRVEPFDAAAWATLQAGIRKPAAVVFTTTDCAHCPAVIAQLAVQARQAPPRARPDLVTVVMDQAPGEDDAALLADAHFSASPRLMAFAGQAAALRHAVDPAWRGVTPYVVFLAPGQAARSVMGPPSADDLARWLASAQRAR